MTENQAREYKWQVDLKVGAQMFHLRTDSDATMQGFSGLTNLSGEAIAKYLGRAGLFSKAIFASLGVLFPFLPLQRLQATATFSQVVFPPRERGKT